MSIKGYYRQEERYMGLNLKFSEDGEKEQVLNAIENTKKKIDIEPSVFEGHSECGGNIYIEFSDDYDKECGDFLESVLAELGIKCECDDVMCTCSN